MSVVDDPDSVRAKKTQDQVSQIKYHGKDRTNPASTPLARPYFSSPGKLPPPYRATLLARAAQLL